MSAMPQKSVLDDEHEQDEEKAFLALDPPEHPAYPQKSLSAGLGRRFWFAAALNCVSTAGIVSSLYQPHTSTRQDD